MLGIFKDWKKIINKTDDVAITDITNLFGLKQENINWIRILEIFLIMK